MFTSLFNFSVFILRHFIKTGTPQCTLHFDITLCSLVNNSFKSIKSLFTFVVEHSLLLQPSERPVSLFVPVFNRGTSSDLKFDGYKKAIPLFFK